MTKRSILVFAVALMVSAAPAQAVMTTKPVPIPGDQVATIIVDGQEYPLQPGQTVTVPAGHDLSVVPRSTTPETAPAASATTTVDSGFASANGLSAEENFAAIRARAEAWKNDPGRTGKKSAAASETVANAAEGEEIVGDEEWDIPVMKKDTHWTTVGKIDVKSLGKYFQVAQRLEKRAGGYYGFSIRNTTSHRLQLQIGGAGLKEVHWDNHGHAVAYPGGKCKCEPGGYLTLWFMAPRKNPW